MSHTTTPSVIHAGFTLTREYPAPLSRVWEAFAQEEQKKQWFGADEGWTNREWQFDFRVGGHDVDEGTFHGGPVSRYEADYTSIVEHERIVTTYNMWIDGKHISTSVASFEFEEIDGGTRLTHTEHGAHLDGLDSPADREAGSNGLLDALGAMLAARVGADA